MSPEEWLPTTAAELSRLLNENATNGRRPVAPFGGRTCLQFGGCLASNVTPISTTELQRVIDYPARDMTITVESGMRLDNLADILKAEGQRLALDIPQRHRATSGGAIATNAGGPGRFGLGTWRDYVIGISAVDGQGRLFSAGGRVVKNVAGYDLCKLLVGSLGTLAVITQVTLKLRPLPASRGLLCTSFPGFANVDGALTRLLSSDTRPMVLDVLNASSAQQISGEAKLALPVGSPLLCVGYEGTEREVAWQMETATAELRPFGMETALPLIDDEADRLWDALTEYQAWSDDPLTFQAALPPSRTMEFLAEATQAGIAAQAHAGDGLVLGHFPDRCTSAESAAEILTPLRHQAESAGGRLIVVQCDNGWLSQLGFRGDPRPADQWAKQLKEMFDPHAVLSPGRLFDAS